LFHRRDPTTLPAVTDPISPARGTPDGAVPQRSVVLVHGAWHGGWCWRRVVPILRDAGLDVHSPSLTGLGDRAHLVSPGVGLATHVEDVVSYLRYNELTDAVLVGHSYAGLVVREAADRVRDRVRTIALLDAWVGPDGSSLDQLAPGWFVDSLRASAATSGFGWLCPPPTPGLVGVTDEADARWVGDLLVAHPLRTFTDRTRLTGAIDGVPHHAAVCRDGLGLPFADMAAAVGCPQPTVLGCGHDAMVTLPAEVAAFVVTAAR
jgi:pimeloyl-ACP methyl ester carboxylesterase